MGAPGYHGWTHTPKERGGVDPLPVFPHAELHIKVFSDTQALGTGDTKFEFMCSEDMDGMNLTKVEAFLSTVGSSGTTVQIRNRTQGHDMLSTSITIDASELDTTTAAIPAVINAATDDVVHGDHICIDVDAAGSGAKGLGVILTFETPLT